MANRNKRGRSATNGSIFMVLVIVLLVGGFRSTSDYTSVVVVDTCDDGIDNDADGLTDMDDTECIDPADGVEDASDTNTP